MQQSEQDSLAAAICTLEAIVGRHDSHQKTGDGAVRANRLPQALPATNPLEVYQQHLLDGFFKSTANEVMYLPTGFGANNVVDAIIHRTLNDQPNKHVVVVVVRPSQALSHAARLSQALNVDVGVFCGGDFLYDFPTDFARNKVLVFTAGLLLRILKLGAYNITQSSLLVLHDAFAAVRNHPMNTLIREYYFKAPITDASHQLPRLLGVVGPQLNQFHRPFDKARQQLRKLCNSLQAGVLLPQGHALEVLVSRLHFGRLFLEGYDQTEQELGLAAILQMHCLAIWDVLHEFNLNHFGRLIHVPQITQPPVAGADAIGTVPGSSAAAAAVGGGGGTGGAQQQVPSIAGSKAPAAVAGTMSAATTTSSTPGSPGSLLSTFPSPRSAFPSPYPSPRSAFPSPRTPGAGEAAAVLASPWIHPADPMQHDWDEIEIMIADTIKQTEALPEEGERRRSEAALAVMQHLDQCIIAERQCMELGMEPCLESLLPALRSLHAFLQTSVEPSAHSEEELLLRKAIERAADGSPLVPWLAELLNFRQELKGRGGEAGADSTESPESAPARMHVLLNLLASLQAPDPEKQNEEDGLDTDVSKDEKKEVQSPVSSSSAAAAAALGGGSKSMGGSTAIAVVVGDSFSLSIVNDAIKAFEGLSNVDVSQFNEVGDAEDSSTAPGAAQEESQDSGKGKRVRITLLTRHQVNTVAGLAFLRSMEDVVWFSAADVMHAASHDLETPALATCRQICSTGPDSKGPNCHVIATVNQAWAYMDICRADQSLLSAMQLVSDGDAALEDRLLQLASGGTLRKTTTTPSSSGTEGLSPFQVKAVEQSACSVLTTICLGLCGKAPTYTVESAGSTMKRYRSVVHLPKAMMVLNEEDESEEPEIGVIQGSATAPPPSSSTTESASAVSLEEKYMGVEAPTSSDAKESAAEHAVLALLHTGILAAYWPSGPLVAQAQSTGGSAAKAAQQYAAALAAMSAAAANQEAAAIAAASAAAAAESEAATGAPPSADHSLVSPFAAAHLTDNLFGRPSPRRHYSPRTLEGGKPACAICGIVATSDQHLEEHLRGRRHQRTLERLQRRLPSATLALARSSSLPTGISGEAGSINLAKRSISLHQGFPCIRVGDIVLPSSMDLRAFLEEMQTLGELDFAGVEPLPRIEETEGQSSSSQQQQHQQQGGSTSNTSGITAPSSFPPPRTTSSNNLTRRNSSGRDWPLPPMHLSLHQMQQHQIPLQQGSMGTLGIALPPGMAHGHGHSHGQAVVVGQIGPDGKRVMGPSPLGPPTAVGGGPMMAIPGGGGGGGGGATSRVSGGSGTMSGGGGGGGGGQWHSPRLHSRFAQQQQMPGPPGPAGAPAVFYPTGYVLSPRGTVPVGYEGATLVHQQYHAVPQYAAVHTTQYHPVAVMPMAQVMVPFATMQQQQGGGAVGGAGGGYVSGLPPRPNSRHVSPRQSPRDVNTNAPNPSQHQQ